MITFNNVEYSHNGKDGRKKSDVAILGAPFDMATSGHAGQRNAPLRIRDAGFWDEGMYSDYYNVDPMESLRIVDAGDVDIAPADLAGGWKAIQDTAAEVYTNTRCLITLGGDHSVSAKAMAGVVSVERDPVTVFHFDAHHDFYRHDPGIEMNHGTWVRWVLENGLANRVVQFGVRGWGLPRTDKTWAAKNDITTYHATSKWADALRQELADTSDPVYMSIDIDVLDPAFAPGVAFREPGGWSVRELFGAVHMIASSGKLIAADVVEVIPDRDTTGGTVKSANRCVAQVLTGLACVEQ